MKNKTLFERLRSWDEECFDLTDLLPEESPPAPVDRPSIEDRMTGNPGLEQRTIRGFRRLYPWLAGLLCAVMISFLLMAVTGLPAYGAADAPAHNEVMERYVTRGAEETGAVNTVTGVILDYRAFDTLGETHVLFTAALAVLILLIFPAEAEEESLAERRIMQRDPILRTTARVLVPVIFLFGFYLILTGHLGPGGGFSGGAILGGGLILYAIAYGFDALDRWLNYKTYRRILLIALCFYSLAKGYSFLCGANGLETIFSAGTPGAILSAGLILPLNLAVGAVVASTMYCFYSVFQRGKV